jgi:hypothetical protein
MMTASILSEPKIDDESSIAAGFSSPLVSGWWVFSVE